MVHDPSVADRALSRYARNAYATPPHQNGEERDSLAPAPPAAPLVGLLQLLEFDFESLHQILHSQPPASFVESLGLRPDNALLHRLILPATMIDLLLQVAPLVDAMRQGALDAGTLAPERRGFGLGSSELVAQRIVAGARRGELLRKRLDDAPQGSDGGGHGFGSRLGVNISLVMRGIITRGASFSRRRRTGREHFGRDTHLGLERVIASPLRPFRA